MKYSNNEVVHKKIGNIEILQFKSLLKYEQDITHCFTLKHGGYSKGNFESLNFGTNVGDNLKIVKQNYAKLCENIGFEYTNLFKGKQIHSDKIVFVNNENCATFINDQEIECDGAITNISNIPLVTNSADCMTVLIYDKKKKCIANIHAGWQGVLNQIVIKGVNKLVKECGCNVQDLIICISPHICTNCFEVMEDVKLKFEDKFKYSNIIYVKDNEHYLIDLQTILRNDLLQVGLDSYNIHFSGVCNKCNIDDFYSYRENLQTGRMACTIMLK